MIANCFNKFFKSVFSYDNYYVPDFGFDGTCSAGVPNLLINLDCKKIPGPDGIPNSFLRCYSLWTSKYLSVIFFNIHL